MNKESKNTRMTREEERLNEGGREFGHVHEPSQTQEASSRKGLADDVTPITGIRQQAPGRTQEGATASRRGSGTQQSRPPGSMRRKSRQSEKKAA